MGTLATVPGALQPAWSALYAGTFGVWPRGEDWQTIAPGQQQHVCGGWRIVAGHDAATGPTVRVRRADAVTGGLELEATFTGAPGQPVYVRQLVPGLPRLAGRQFAPTFSVSSDAAQLWDVYARSRYNAEDAQRLPVVDTQTLTVPAGVTQLTVPAIVPALEDPAAAGWPLTWRGCVELALRLWGDAAGTRRAVVRWAAMPAGTTPAAPPLTTQQEDQTAVGAYEEVVPFRLTGLSGDRGQKSTWVRYQEKALPVQKAQVTLYDALGNRGYVSGHLADGRRVDRVPATVGEDLETGLQKGASVLLANTSTYMGLSGRLHVASY